MGLDLVEFVMEVEEVFQYRFPNEDLLAITTPGKLIDYLATRLPAEATRRVSVSTDLLPLAPRRLARVGCHYAAIHPDTSLLKLIAADCRHATWQLVRNDAGMDDEWAWPRLAEPGWLDVFRRRRVGTLRETVRSLLPDIKRSPRPGWTRSELAATIDRLMRGKFGVSLNEDTEDKTWQELGVG